VTPIKADGLNQGVLAAKERKERKEKAPYFYAIPAFFCG
jgi:hypothetical protein